MKAHPAPGLHR